MFFEDSITPEILAIRRRKLKLLQEKAALVKGFGLLNYAPHPKQDRFHRAGNYRRRLVTAGNRFGKSLMGCGEDCAWLYGERIWYPKSDPARTAGLPTRPVKGLVITIDWDKVDEIWTSERGDQPGKLWQLLPADFIKSKRRNHSGAISVVECANGSTLTFDTVKSWKANPLGSESSDWDFIHVDEPCPEKMWKAHSRGLVDRGGWAWFTLTPLQEVWILDYFFPRTTSRRELPEEAAEGTRWAIRGSMHDNPYLSQEGKDEYIRTLTPEERDCRVSGIPLELAGLIYKNFDFDRHVLKAIPKGWTSYSTPPLEWPTYGAVDPHPRLPHAALFLTVSPLGQKFVYDEVFRRVHTGIFCDEELRPRLAPRNVIYVKCDPMAWIESPIDGRSIQDDFADHGIFVEKSSKALSQGIMKVQEELGYDDNIYISPHVEEFLYEIQRYCWDEDKEKPVDKDDHMMECFYRLLIEDPKWIPRSDHKNNPIGDMVIDSTQLRLDDINFNTNLD